jgi:hypothetical protein
MEEDLTAMAAIRGALLVNIIAIVPEIARRRTRRYRSRMMRLAMWGRVGGDIGL